MVRFGKAIVPGNFSGMGARRDNGFSSDEAGSVGIFFALTCLTVMLVIAVSIDYGRADLEHQRVQRAADAAALAASHRLGLPDQDVSGQDVALRFFKANTDGRTNEQIESVVLDATRGEVRVRVGGTVFSSLLNAVGINSIGIDAGSQVIKGDGTVEVALVLDNSGSMAGQPIADLKTAAKNLTNVVFTGSAQSERVKVSVVPFSSAVNVGAQFAASAWIDHAGQSPLNGANFATDLPRLDVFAKMGVAWKGCVEARPAPHDVTADPPVAGHPETLFVPMLAPDEPDSVNAGGKTYPNNYLKDDGGSCPPQPVTCLSYSRRGNCTSSVTTPLAPADAQSRMCKYDNAFVGSTTPGPNYMCDSEAIQTLTESQAEVESKLSVLVAKGNTNIAEGVMWGWRSLSPDAPFALGRPYNIASNDKILVLMTDGANTYSAYSNHNKSSYGAQGYGASNRLGTTYTSAGYLAQMNNKTLAACANAKAAGLKIYTVAFRLQNDPTALSVLQGCASQASMAFQAADGNALIAAFERIGTEISKLRVAG